MKQYTTLFRNGKKETEILELREEPKEAEREKDLVNLYPQVQYQTIDGFGGAFTDAAGYVFSRMPETLQEQFLEDCFSSGGLNYTLGRTSVDS